MLIVDGNLLDNLGVPQWSQHPADEHVQSVVLGGELDCTGVGG